MIVRSATPDDASAMALVIAEVAPEGLIGAEAMWVLEEGSQIVGAASVQERVDLEVWTDNFRAIALYGSVGFEVEGLRLHYRRSDGSLRSTLVMGRLRRDVDRPALTAAG